MMKVLACSFSQILYIVYKTMLLNGKFKKKIRVIYIYTVYFLRLLNFMAGKSQLLFEYGNFSLLS